MLRSLILSGLCLLPAAPLVAHPHVFVNTSLRLFVDAAGNATGVEVAWEYDAFYSLLVLEDLKLDNDGDGRLSENELQRLTGFDLNWAPEFEGDVYVTSGEAAVTLGAPEVRPASVEDGVITTRHYRALSAPADALEIRAYDPTFYTAYALAGTPEADGGCEASVLKADLDKAYTLVEELLYALPADASEDDYPAVGAAFADTVTVTCAS